MYLKENFNKLEDLQDRMVYQALGRTKKVPRDVLLAKKLLWDNFLNNKPKRVKDLANELNTTEAFLQQIIRKLRIAGLIKIKRGPGGGIYL